MERLLKKLLEGLQRNHQVGQVLKDLQALHRGRAILLMLLIRLEQLKVVNSQEMQVLQLKQQMAGKSKVMVLGSMVKTDKLLLDGKK